MKTKSNQNNPLLILIILLIMSLVGAKLYFEDQKTKVPYPYWTSASEHGVAVLYGEKIYVCDLEGKIKEELDLPSGTKPCQLTWHNQDILVADWQNYAVHFFSKYGITTTKLLGGPEISAHINAAIDPQGEHIYLTDSQGSKIHVYDMNGNYQESFGSMGIFEGSLLSPKDIHAVLDGLYVGNFGRSAIDKFDYNGNFIKTMVKSKGKALYVALSDFSAEGNRFNTIECDVLLANCLIGSYDDEGTLLNTVDHSPGLQSVGDLSTYNNILYVSDTANRVINKYDSTSLAPLGVFSHEIEQLGNIDTQKVKAFGSYAKYSLIALLVSCLPAAFLYWQSKR